MTGYSITLKDEDKIAKALGKEIRASPKWALEICRELRGKNLEKAKEILGGIITLEHPVPLRRYNKGVAHRRGLKKADAGRYPVKAASHILKVLRGAEANAEYKGLDPERLYVKHISAQRGRIIRGFRPRAFGRATPHNENTTNVQVVLEER